MNDSGIFPDRTCSFFANEYYIGFRIVEAKKGDIFEGKKLKYHSLVFMLEGEVEFSYDEFVGHHFKQGDLFFIPQVSLMYGVAVDDSRMLVLTFNNGISTLCDNCKLSKHSSFSQSQEYDFSPLSIHPMLHLFITSMEEYIKKGLRCSFFQQLKQKELFVLLKHCYAKEEMEKIFHPIIGISSFNTWVLENYSPEMGMSELASLCNMTPKSFSRKFVEKFGITYREWALQQKIKHVKFRLSMSDVSFKDIMRDFNFSNPSHFSRFCKENYGLAPKALVNSLRNNHKTD